MDKESYDRTLFKIENGVLKEYLKKDVECDCVEIPTCVKEIGAYAFACAKMRSVRFLGDTEVIGEGAFSYCLDLERVDFPSALRTIGAEAFRWCLRLIKFRIPASVSKIGPGAFMGISSSLYDRSGRILYPSKIEVDEGNDSFALKDGFLYSKDGARLLWCSDSLEGDVLVRDGVETVDEGAFYSCIFVESVTLPDTVREIGELEFGSCLDLTSVALPDGMTKIGDRAFEGCRFLEEIALPDGVTKIGEAAFDGCWSLTSVTIPDSVTEIGEGAFGGCGALREIALPDGVETLRSNTFDRCESLERVKLPGGLKRIEKGAFRRCDSLNFLAIPASAEKLDDRFASSKGFSSVAFEDPYDWTYIDRNGKEKIADPFVLMDPPKACIFLQTKSRGMIKKRDLYGSEAEL